MKSQIKDLCLTIENTSIRMAMSCIDRNAGKPVLITDNKDNFVNIVTDGDIRRALLRGLSLDEPITTILEYKLMSKKQAPVTCLFNTSSKNILLLMKQYAVRYIPLLDEGGRVVELANLNDLEQSSTKMKAVIMAGGLGTRLRPLTNDLPKPMLLVGNKPLLETVLDQLSSQGVNEVFISTFYRSEKIIEYFGDGSDFGIQINYLEEDRLTGTAGALRLLPEIDVPILVINGDIITKMSFKSMLGFHHDNKADLTVGLWQYQVKIEYGVVETKGIAIQGITEKPSVDFLINAGVYLLSPKCLYLVPNCIPEGQTFHITDLLKSAINRKYAVIGFPIHESWLDIGQPKDYEQAQTEHHINGN